MLDPRTLISFLLLALLGLSAVPALVPPPPQDSLSRMVPIEVEPETVNSETGPGRSF